jgi:hypothetical protein
MQRHGSLIPVSPVALVVFVALGAAAAPASAQDPSAARSAADQKQSHYQIGTMERVLEGAVEHGVALTRDRLQAIADRLQTIGPAQMLILDNPRVRGFRLDSYGVFFDVEVPSLNGTLTWSLRTLDQNDLGLQSAMNILKTHVNADGNVDLQQALKRVELQVGPATLVNQTTPVVPGSRDATGATSGGAEQQAGVPAQPIDPILTNPNAAYRGEVVQALVDAMLDYSGPLGIGAEEWLTIAARGIEERPRLTPADNDPETVVIRARGADLKAFHAGQISREEVVKRIERRVF